MCIRPFPLFYPGSSHMAAGLEGHFMYACIKHSHTSEFCFLIAGCAQKSSKGRYPCPNHFNWLISTWVPTGCRSSSPCLRLSRDTRQRKLSFGHYPVRVGQSWGLENLNFFLLGQPPLNHNNRFNIQITASTAPIRTVHFPVTREQSYLNSFAWGIPEDWKQMSVCGSRTTSASHS